MAILSQLGSVANIAGAAGALTGLLLVTPSNQGYQPQALPGSDPYSAPEKLTSDPPSFLFHYEGENSITLDSDITDHYVEDNSSIADHIAIKPETISTSGFIGELNDVPPKLLNALKGIADKLTLLTPYAPVLSITALRAYNQAQFAYTAASQITNSAFSSISNLGSLFGIGSGAQNQQQVYFTRFYKYFKNRTLFTVQTPWLVFNNMAIKSLRVIQDEDTQLISNFEITFKKIRFAQTIVTNTSLLGQGRINLQNAALSLLGSSTPGGSTSVGSQAGASFGLGVS